VGGGGGGMLIIELLNWLCGNLPVLSKRDVCRVSDVFDMRLAKKLLNSKDSSDSRHGTSASLVFLVIVLFVAEGLLSSKPVKRGILLMLFV